MIELLRVASGLRAAGVMGINWRNAEYTLPHNERRLYPLVDDKLETKRVAEKAGVAVPPLYAVVQIEREIRDLPGKLAAYEDFVVKPARGSQGDGIAVVVGRSRSGYRLADGTSLTEADLAFHVSNILSGVFSLGGQTDRALVEYRVQFDPVFESVTYRGVPDIRVIVFLGVPVMAMVRLPTRMSRGKANLHQGALGAGIDMTTGTTLSAVWRDRIVDEHPDTGAPVAGVRIPGWDVLLDIAARSYELTGLGYIGIDLVLDREKGPLVLELNARPGLAIQLANRAGLASRLEAARAEYSSLATVAERVRFAKERFGRRA
jgi:alpha-L-glutamate ligase-like protein